MRSRLGGIAYRIIGIGENDIGLVNELLKGLTTPAMIAEATLIQTAITNSLIAHAPLPSFVEN